MFEKILRRSKAPLKGEQTTRAYWAGLLVKHGTISGIQAATGHTWNTIRDYLRRYDLEYDHTTTPLEFRRKPFDWEVGFSRLLTTYHFFNELLMKQDLRLRALGDLHIPWQDLEAVKKALSYLPEADVLVLTADILDWYSLSRFRKEQAILPLDEFREAMRILPWIIEKFAHVVIMQGNHDIRDTKKILDMLGPEMTEVLEQEGRVTALEALVKGNERCHILPWFAQIGDVVFGHPDNFLSAALKTSERFEEYWRLNIYDKLKLPYEMLVVAHTHRWKDGRVKGKFVMEPGCLCRWPDYAVRGKMPANPEPMELGFADILVRKGGHVDINESRKVYLGVAR